MYTIDQLDTLFNSIYCDEAHKYIELWKKGIKRTIAEGKTPYFDFHIWISETSGKEYKFNNDTDFMSQLKYKLDYYLEEQK